MIETKQMTEGEVYVSERGLVGMACRHPMNPQGRVDCVETADGRLVAVYPSRMRKATKTQARRWKVEAGGFDW